MTSELTQELITKKLQEARELIEEISNLCEYSVSDITEFLGYSPRLNTEKTYKNLLNYFGNDDPSEDETWEDDDELEEETEEEC